MLSGAILDLDSVLIDCHTIHKIAWRRFLLRVDKYVSDAELEFVTSPTKCQEILCCFLGDLRPEQIEEFGRQKDHLFLQVEGVRNPLRGGAWLAKARP